MISKIKLIAATLFFSIVMIEPALASSMRCGSHLITASNDRGPGMYEVLKKCGEPDERYGNTWVYKKSSSVKHVVRFNNDGMIYYIE